MLEEETVVNKNKEFDDLCHIYQNADEKFRSVIIEITLNGRLIELKLDTGVYFAVITQRYFILLQMN